MLKKVKIWFQETRPQFLLLSVVLVALGTAIAWYDGYFNWSRFVLTLLGLLLVHISVNVLNDYFDYKSGIDLEVQRTPFSGGSGILPQGLLKPESVYKFGLGCMGVALIIGLYLTLISGWKLLPLIIVGGVVSYFYTPHLTRWLIGELWAGLGMGALPVLGIYFVQTGEYNLGILIASLAPGFLTANLLFLNEFPDVGPDEKAGRYHLVIALGRRKASRLYLGLVVVVYLCIIGGVVSKLMPAITFIALATTPFAFKAVRGALKDYDHAQKIVPALGANVMTVLGTDALLALSYFLARIFHV